MGNTAVVRVLDVGQCGLDHGRIVGLLSARFGAVVHRADVIDEAVDAVAGGKYDLVLVNRIFDADGSEGLEFIKRLKGDTRTALTPVMMVSNYAEAQAAAMAAGAKRGFGKDSFQSPATLEALSSVLDR